MSHLQRIMSVVGTRPVRLRTSALVTWFVYTAELFDIIAGRGLRAHCYADDTQMYTSTPATDIPSTVLHFVQCMDDVSEWVA